MSRNSVFMALFFISIGFAMAYLLVVKPDWPAEPQPMPTDISTTTKAVVSNPFSVVTGGQKNNKRSSGQRLDRLENEVSLIRKQLQRIEQRLEKQVDSALAVDGTSTSHLSGRMPYSALNRQLYSLDNLIRGGIDPVLAEDIVRKKSSIELKRLELQDHAKRNGYLNTQRYYDELEAINQDDVSLRQMLGDKRYDEYLFNSKQNNRIRIASVMLGSAAEQAGIQQGDVVLSYDNERLFSWQELKQATTEGNLGEYVSISIDRDGEIYSFSIPRGPLGVQLGATRRQP